MSGHNLCPQKKSDDHCSGRVPRLGKWCSKANPRNPYSPLLPPDLKTQDVSSAGAAAHLLHLPGQVQKPKVTAMSALRVYGALHGGARGLCSQTGIWTISF